MAMASTTISTIHTITILSSMTLTSTLGATAGDGLLGEHGMALCGDGVATVMLGRTGAMDLDGMWATAAFRTITDAASTEVAV